METYITDSPRFDLGGDLLEGDWNAAQIREFSEGNQPEHLSGGQSRTPAKASGGNCDEQSREKQPRFGKFVVKLPEASRKTEKVVSKDLEIAELEEFFPEIGKVQPRSVKGATKVDDKRIDSTWERGRKAKPEGYSDKIVSISHTHEAIMSYMIAFPHHGLREIGDYFGYSPSWISQLINSDLFKSKLRERQDAHYSKLSTTLVEKLEAAANVGVEKLTDMMEKSQDPKFIKESTSDILSRLGFGAPKSPAGIQFNAPGAQVMMINSGDLAEARKIMRESGKVIPLPSPAELKVGNEG